MPLGSPYLQSIILFSPFILIASLSFILAAFLSQLIPCLYPPIWTASLSLFTFASHFWAIYHSAQELQGTLIDMGIKPLLAACKQIPPRCAMVPVMLSASQLLHSLSPEEPHVISATVGDAFQRSCASDPILFLDLSNPWESLHYNGLPVPKTASEQKDESHILT